MILCFVTFIFLFIEIPYLRGFDAVNDPLYKGTPINRRGLDYSPPFSINSITASIFCIAGLIGIFFFQLKYYKAKDKEKMKYKSSTKG